MYAINSAVALFVNKKYVEKIWVRNKVSSQFSKQKAIARSCKVLLKWS